MRLLPTTLLGAALLFFGCGGGSTQEAPPFPAEGSLSSISPAITQRPLLVVRLAYENVAFHSDAASWHNLLFGHEPKQLNHYFEEVSYGKFRFSPAAERDGSENDGIVSVTLQRAHPDSGSNDSIHTDLADALRAADSFIDFKTFDSNGDGALQTEELAIVFIVAGNEDAYSGDNSRPGIWAHQSCINKPLRLDGLRLMQCDAHGNYAVFGERHNDHPLFANHDATIGIIAHELGHAVFALPDLYDITDRSAGIGYFGLMGSGMWAQEAFNDLPGNTPVHLCAWSKLYNRWVEPETYSETLFVPVQLHESASRHYNIARIPLTEHEYFLLENRNKNGYDRGLYSLDEGQNFQGGVAIWHIDESRLSNNNISNLNNVNSDVTRKGVDLEEASHPQLDADPANHGHIDNLYFTGNADTFAPYTTPSTNAYAGTASGISITDISAASETMQLTVTNPNKGK